MTVALDILRELRRLGVLVRVTDGEVQYRPAGAVHAPLATRMKLHRAALVSLLSTPPEALDPDTREVWEERSAIMEYDAGMDRQTAEAAALADVLGMRVDTCVQPR